MMITGVASSIGVILGTWFLIVKFFTPAVKRASFWFTTWENFMRDWAGTPAEPGRDSVPGVMERLNRIDGELKHNGGSSIKDQVARLEKELKIADQLRKETNEKIDQIHLMLTNQETKKSRAKNS